MKTGKILLTNVLVIVTGMLLFSFVSNPPVVDKQGSRYLYFENEYVLKGVLWVKSPVAPKSKTNVAPAGWKTTTAKEQYFGQIPVSGMPVWNEVSDYAAGVNPNMQLILIFPETVLFIDPQGNVYLAGCIFGGMYRPNRIWPGDPNNAWVIEFEGRMPKKQTPQPQQPSVDYGPDLENLRNRLFSLEKQYAELLLKCENLESKTAKEFQNVYNRVADVYKRLDELLALYEKGMIRMDEYEARLKELKSYIDQAVYNNNSFPTHVRPGGAGYNQVVYDNYWNNQNFMATIAFDIYQGFSASFGYSTQGGTVMGGYGGFPNQGGNWYGGGYGNGGYPRTGDKTVQNFFGPVYYGDNNGNTTHTNSHNTTTNTSTNSGNTTTTTTNTTHNHTNNSHHNGNTYNPPGGGNNNPGGSDDPGMEGRGNHGEGDVVWNSDRTKWRYPNDDEWHDAGSNTPNLPNNGGGGNNTGNTGGSSGGNNTGNNGNNQGNPNNNGYGNNPGGGNSTGNNQNGGGNNNSGGNQNGGGSGPNMGGGRRSFSEGSGDKTVASAQGLKSTYLANKEEARISANMANQNALNNRRVTDGGIGGTTDLRTPSASGNRNYSHGSGVSNSPGSSFETLVRPRENGNSSSLAVNNATDNGVRDNMPTRAPEVRRGRGSYLENEGSNTSGNRYSNGSGVRESPSRTAPVQKDSFWDSPNTARGNTTERIGIDQRPAPRSSESYYDAPRTRRNGGYDPGAAGGGYERRGGIGGRGAGSFATPAPRMPAAPMRSVGGGGASRGGGSSRGPR